MKHRSNPQASNQTEMNRAPHLGMYEVGRLNPAGEFATLPAAAIAAWFAAHLAAHQAWLRMLHEPNAESLNPYDERFWLLTAFCMLPWELARRSFAVYLGCHPCITESVEQPRKTANLPGPRIERTPPVLREPVESVAHAMDIAIGAEKEPWIAAKAA